MTSYEYTQVISLLEKYKGDIKANSNAIWIENANTLEWQSKQRKVNCYVRVSESQGNYRFNVDAEEQTISIIGGCASPCETLEQALKQAKQMLNRYKFEKKEIQQTSLF